MLRPLLPLLGLLVLLTAPLAAEDSGEVFKRSRAEVAPFPREVSSGKQTEIRVRPVRKHHTPILAVTAPDGTTRYLRPIDKDEAGWERFEVDFPGGRGAYRFELVVDSSDKGDVTAAQFTIWVGVERPKEKFERKSDADYAPEPEDAHLLVLERKLFRLVNAYRKTKRLPPFPWLEDTAILGRDHLTDYLKMRPRPKDMVHIIPSYGAIADRFEDLRAVQTHRKFPVAKPEIGPDAVSYISESLAMMSSIDWLFEQYFLKESAFLKPIQSNYPTHASVAMVRHPENGKLLSAFIYVQVNATRVLKAMAAKKKETIRLESRARDPQARAEFLRKIARQSDPKSFPIYRKRLARNQPPVVHGAALDAIFLNAPEEFAKWMGQQQRTLEKSRTSEDYRESLPVLRALATVEWNAPVRRRAERELRFVTRLSGFELEAAERKIAEGDPTAGREQLESIARRFPGLPAAEKAEARLKELSDAD